MNNNELKEKTFTKGVENENSQSNNKEYNPNKEKE